MGTRLKLFRRRIAQRLPWRKAPPAPMVPRPELWPKVQAILADNLITVNRSEITPTAHLFDDLGMDSMESIEVVMAIEEEFGVEIPDEDAENLKTVPELLQYLEEKLQHAQRPDRG